MPRVRFRSPLIYFFTNQPNFFAHGRDNPSEEVGTAMEAPADYFMCETLLHVRVVQGNSGAISCFYIRF